MILQLKNTTAAYQVLIGLTLETPLKHFFNRIQLCPGMLYTVFFNISTLYALYFGNEYLK